MTKRTAILRFSCIVAILFSVSWTIATSIEITLLHTNDFHSHFEEFNRDGDRCTREEAEENACYGGVARLVTKVKEIRARDHNTLLLDAGDQLQGSNWYYHYEGRATAYFFNKIGYDAMTLSNHEFDSGVDTLANYLDRLAIPVVSSNIDTRNEPVLQGKLFKSTIVPLSGEKIGIVGFTTWRTPIISNPGDVIFEDEVESIRREVNKLTSNGVNKIIVIGSDEHEMSLRIANEVQGVDIVAGTDPATLRAVGRARPTDKEVQGEYPFVVRQERSGDTALVVQVQIFARYLGYLRVTFDEQGKIIRHSGKPVLLDHTVPQDEGILSEIKEWAKPIRLIESNRVGDTSVRLVGEASVCRVRECNLGNLVTDAYVAAFATNQGEDGWSDVSIALMVSGGIRDSIEQGTVKASHIQSVLPFTNTIDMVDLRGHHILDALERSVEKFDIKLLPGFFLQVSGIRVTYDLSNTPGHRVKSVRVKCTECAVPEFEPLVMNKVYKVVIPEYMANGGDGYHMISDNMENLVKGKLDADILTNYIQQHSPIVHGIEGRITVEGEVSGAPLVTSVYVIIASLSFTYLLMTLI